MACSCQTWRCPSLLLKNHLNISRSSWHHNNHHHHHHHHHHCIQRRNWRFFTVSSLCREPYQTRTLKWPGCYRVQITCNTSSICHMQHVVLRATWYEGTAQLLSLTELKSCIYFIFIGWTINQWKSGRNRSTQRKPLVTSFRKRHILKPEDSSPKRDSNLHNSIGGRLGKQRC